MQLYEVTYEGLWLGGVAIVQAESEQQALDLVANHKGTAGFESTTVMLLVSDPAKPQVLYNDNGNY